MSPIRAADPGVQKNSVNDREWWEELGRSTLTAVGDSITLTGLPSRKYLRVLVSVLATGGTTTVRLRFNNDATNNYTYKENFNGVEGSNTSVSFVDIGGGVSSSPAFSIAEIVNVAGQEKLVNGQGMSANTAGAANVPAKNDIRGKWANTSNAISRIDVVNFGTGDFAVGSQLIVLGHN